MRAILSLLLNVYVMVFIATPAFSADWQPSVASVTNDIIRPSYAKLTNSFDSLLSASEKLCSSPTQDNFQATQSAWRQTMQAWMGVSWIHFGPISAGSSRFDIQLWPIRKGVTHKRVQALLANAELTSEQVDESGVSVRGLTGSEYLLFSGSGGQLSDYQDASKKNRCMILQQSIKNGLLSAQALLKAWQTKDVIAPYKQGVDMLDDTKVYESSASIIWNALLSEVEFIQLRKLEGPINPHAKKAKPTLTESWRSLNSLANIQYGLETLKQIYSVGFGETVAAENSDLNNHVLSEFDQLISEVKGFKQPMFMLLKESAGRDRLIALDKRVHQFYMLLRNDVTPLTGFTLGFNANDGD